MLTRHLAARRSCVRFPLALLLVLLVFASGHAQQTAATSPAGALNLTRDALRVGDSVRTDKATWRFHAGDDAAWAASRFDDSGWRAVSGSTLDLNTLGQVGWQGAGWFRLRFTTDESLRGEVVGLSMSHSLAASEIYLDGKLIRRFGVIGEGKGDARFFNVFGTPVAVTLDDAGEHVLAVRYRSAIEDPASRLARWMYEGGGGEGFNFAFAEINDAAARREQTQRSNAARVVSRASIYLAVGLLHLLLFWFYTAQRANLYFGIYAFFTAISTFAAYAQSAGGATNLYELFAYRLLTRFCFALYSTAFLMFLYSAFLSGVPRRFTRYLIPLWLTTLAAGLLFPASRAYTIVFATMTVWYIFENLRVMTLAVRRGAEGSWIVLAGVLTAPVAPGACSSYQDSYSAVMLIEDSSINGYLE